MKYTAPNIEAKKKMKVLGYTDEIVANALGISVRSFINKLNVKNNQHFSKCERYCLAAILDIDVLLIDC